MNNWVDYWSQETQFVCDDHKRLSYEAIYKDLRRYLKVSDRVLDFGCGEGLFASKLSKHCSELYLYDASQLILDRLAEKIDNKNIQIINDYKKVQNINLVLISSVSQYIPDKDFFSILHNLRSSLSKHGTIIISDVIPPKNSIFIEILDLIKISVQNGFLFRAILKMLLSLFGNYSKMRNLLPLTKYNLDSFKDRAEGLGFLCQVEKINLGLNSNRLTIVLTKIE